MDSVKNIMPPVHLVVLVTQMVVSVLEDTTKAVIAQGLVA
jgi:hypothetical protein